MPVPPLNEGILNTGINRVAFEDCPGNLDGINDMKNCYGNKSGNVKPDGNINMFNPAFEDGPHHVPAKNNPNSSNQNVDWPFEFGIFLTGSVSGQ